MEKPHMFLYLLGQDGTLGVNQKRAGNPQGTTVAHQVQEKWGDTEGGRHLPGPQPHLRMSRTPMRVAGSPELAPSPLWNSRRCSSSVSASVPKNCHSVCKGIHQPGRKSEKSLFPSWGIDIMSPWQRGTTVKMRSPASVCGVGEGGECLYLHSGCPTFSLGRGDPS